MSNQIEPTLSLDGAASKEGVTGDKNSDAAAVLSLKNVKALLVLGKQKCAAAIV